MTKQYRVVKENDKYYPECRETILFGLITDAWRRFYESESLEDENEDWRGDKCFKTMSEAVLYCNAKKAKLKSVEPKSVVVWRSHSQ
jgi:hypothetical protein